MNVFVPQRLITSCRIEEEAIANVPFHTTDVAGYVNQTGDGCLLLSTLRLSLRKRRGA